MNFSQFLIVEARDESIGGNTDIEKKLPQQKQLNLSKNIVKM